MYHFNNLNLNFPFDFDEIEFVKYKNEKKC